MAGRRRSELSVEAQRRNLEQLSRLGGVVRDARIRRGVTQASLGARVGLSRMSVSRAERGFGGGLTLDAWQRLAIALDITLRIELQRDPKAEPQDAGHLRIQELVLRLGRAAGYRGLFELPTKPDDPWRSIDVGLADDRNRRLLVVECWNVIGDLGAAARGSARKLAEADALAALRWGDSPHRTALVWVIAATRRNRELLARYPEIFAARFPGSSAAWVKALTDGTAAPAEPGVVWATSDGERLFPWRRRARSAAGNPAAG